MSQTTGKQLSIKSNMLWNSFGSLTNLFCQWLLTVLVVRLSSGFDAAGILAIAMSVANIFAPIAQYRMRSYQVSDTNKETSAGEYIAFRIITILIAFTVSFAYMLIASEPVSYLATLVYLLYKSVESFIDVLHGVDQQHLRMDFCGRSMALRGVLSLIAFSLVLAIANNLELAIFAMFLSVLPAIVLDWRNAEQFDSLTPHITVKKTIYLLKSCFPGAVGTSICSAVTSIARQTLSNISGATMLGIYASVCTPVVIVQAGSSYIYSPLLGVFAKHLNQGNKSRFNNLLAKVTLAMIGLLIAGLIAFRFFGSWFLLAVFGEQIASYDYLMYPAIVSVVSCAYCTFLCDLLIASRTMLGVLIGNLIAFALVSALSPILINLFGPNGTSYAISISYFAASGYMLAHLRVALSKC